MYKSIHFSLFTFKERGILIKEWLEPEDVKLSKEFREIIGGSPFVLETLMRRGITTVDSARAFINPNYYIPSPSSELPHMEKAVERIYRAIKNDETICVWGDFDVDGQTSTTLLYSTLKDIGAKVFYHIPLRHTESHGVNIPVLKKKISEGAKLILTCDTGITANEAVAFAGEHNIDVIITDHHDLPTDLPPAYATINPKMLPRKHPLAELPGVGCAYKLAEELYRHLSKEKNVFKHMDLVALGIVADIANLSGDTRYLLQKGLQALRNTERAGLHAIMEISELNPANITEEHISFILGPRLNALGRLSDANIVVDLLTTDDLSKARIIATQIEGLNSTRKLISDQVLAAAQEQINKDPSLLEYNLLLLSHHSWPPGIIGIVANRLAEFYNKPVILMSTQDKDIARGSARSVPGYNIFQAIWAHRDMLITFGGHPMAAGLSIHPERIPEFRKAISKTIGEMIKDCKIKPVIQIDTILSLGDLTINLLEDFERLSPFGAGNPSPVFMTRGVTVRSQCRMGRKNEHFQLILEDNKGVSRRVIWWHGDNSLVPRGKFDIVYTGRCNNYRGVRDIQLEWIDGRPIEEVILIKSRDIQIIDYRYDPSPLLILERLKEKEAKLEVWSEGDKELYGKNRYDLKPCNNLVIWTTPPGPGELQYVIEKVCPSKIYLVGMDPEVNTPESFLKILTGIVKYALKSNNGRVSIHKIAAKTSHREITVKKGIKWLLSRGYIEIIEENENEIVMKEGDKRASGSSVINQIRILIEETSAYRTYFMRADKDNLIRR